MLFQRLEQRVSFCLLFTSWVFDGERSSSIRPEVIREPEKLRNGDVQLILDPQRLLAKRGPVIGPLGLSWILFRTDVSANGRVLGGR